MFGVERQNFSAVFLFQRFEMSSGTDDCFLIGYCESASPLEHRDRRPKPRYSADGGHYNIRGERGKFGKRLRAARSEFFVLQKVEQRCLNFDAAGGEIIVFRGIFLNLFSQQFFVGKRRKSHDPETVAVFIQRGKHLPAHGPRASEHGNGFYSVAHLMPLSECGRNHCLRGKKSPRRSSSSDASVTRIWQGMPR